MFIDCLDVDETIAQLLVTEGFASVEEVAFVPPDELAAIGGFDEELAGELIRRANDFLEARNAEFTKERLALGVEDAVAEINGLTPAMLVTLGKAGIKTLDDLGDLAADELLEMLPDSGLGETEANAVIMAARAHWFGDEAAAGDGAVAPA